MAAKFEDYTSGSQYRFRLKAGNGEIVASGEAYETKAGAHQGCEAVKRADAAAHHRRRLVSDDRTEHS